MSGYATSEVVCLGLIDEIWAANVSCRWPQKSLSPTSQQMPSSTLASAQTLGRAQEAKERATALQLKLRLRLRLQPVRLAAK